MSYSLIERKKYVDIAPPIWSLPRTKGPKKEDATEGTMRTVSNIDAETAGTDGNIDYDKLLFRYGILTQMVKVIFSALEDQS